MDISKNYLKEPDKWVLRLYVAGHTVKSVTAFNNLKKICEEQLKNRFTIEVFDLLENPQSGKENYLFR